MTTSNWASELRTAEKMSGRMISPVFGSKCLMNKLIVSKINFELALTPEPGWHPYTKIILPDLVIEAKPPRVSMCSLLSSSSSASYSSRSLARFSSTHYLSLSISLSLSFLISRQHA